MVLTQSKLKLLLSYNKNTGVFVRLCGHFKGRVAGGRDEKGYIRIRVDGNKYKAHRLAWFYVYGEWPNGQIDHINRIKDDNRLSNLRVVSNSQNKQNNYSARADNICGKLGVSARDTGFAARITVNGRTKCLGTYKSLEEAHQAYLQAKTKYHEISIS